MFKMFKRNKKVESPFSSKSKVPNVSIKNLKPEGETYIIVKGSELRNGDTIIHRGNRFTIEVCGPGHGAGSLDFGEYVWIEGSFSAHVNSPEPKTFWLYENSPIVKCVS